MPKSQEFLTQPATETVQEPIKLEMAEMKADASAFPEELQSLLKKFLEQESLSPDEAGAIRDARATWWEEKYGFPYRDKKARREVIYKKYAPSEELAKARALQEKLLASAENENAGEVTLKLKKEYEEAFPDQMEGIEAMFGLMPFLQLSRKVSIDHEKGVRGNREDFQDMTEYQFLLTHFLKTNNDDKEFLGLFWKTLETLAGQEGYSKEFNRIRRGIITQIATFRIFEELGFKPALSHPSEDAFRSIDLWSDAHHAVQVKSTGADLPIIMETDEISFPGVEVKQGGETKQFSSKMFDEAQRFKVKVRDYEKVSGKGTLKGYFVVIPHSKVDFITGEPDKQLVKFVKDGLAHDKEKTELSRAA